MELLETDGTALAYRIFGSGEPVVLVHGALIPDSFLPVAQQPAWAEHFGVVLYHRRGNGESPVEGGPISFAQQVADLHALARHLGQERLHLVGHSYGGAVCLLAALEIPGLVHTLTLLEPAFFGENEAEQYRSSLRDARQRFRTEGAKDLVDDFMAARMGDGHRERLERAIPGAMAQSLANASNFFERELDALLSWEFGLAQLRQIAQPALSVVGEVSIRLWPRFAETHQTLLREIPGAEGAVVEGASHMMQADCPNRVAATIAAFLRRHPMSP